VFRERHALGVIVRVHRDGAVRVMRRRVVCHAPGRDSQRPANWANEKAIEQFNDQKVMFYVFITGIKAYINA